VAKLGVKGKNAVVYFYNANGSKDCTTQAIAFDEAHAEFKDLKFNVVGVRSAADADSQFVQHYPQLRGGCGQQRADSRQLVWCACRSRNVRD